MQNFSEFLFIVLISEHFRKLFPKFPNFFQNFIKFLRNFSFPRKSFKIFL